MAIFLVVIILVLIFVYVHKVRQFDYWRKRNVQHASPIPMFGNHFLNVFGIKNMMTIAEELYRKYPHEKLIGHYRGSSSDLIITDPDIIRDVLNVDFPYFHPRGTGRNSDKEPLQANLFHAEGDTWKLLRQGLTPAFTSAKLKSMFPLVVRCAEKLHGVAEEIVSRGGECDMRDLMARFTIEFIGACGFGIEMDTINNENSRFRQLGNIIFRHSTRHLLISGLWELFPKMRDMLHISKPEVEECIMDLVKAVREKRNYKPIGRHDFIDLLLEMETKGRIQGESMEKKNLDGSPALVELEMDLKCMAGQVFVFFIAGFESSTSVTSYTLHQLAFNPDLQERIQKEIDDVLSRHDNKLCYDAVAEMNLLDMALKESLRMFPSPGILNRVCAKQYKFQDLDLTIDPGIKIIIPIKSLHNDERYFPNPDEYKPERFSPEAVKKRHKYVYLPFGEGPRTCIGPRLGQMQSLAGLAALLQKFSVEPAARSRRHLRVDQRNNIVQVAVPGVPLVLKKRNERL